MKLSKEYNLKIANPELSNEWNYNKNGNLAPDKVTPVSGKKVWWICINYHEWQARISNRHNGSQCPYCIGSLPTPSNNLKVKFPEIAIQWHVTKNVNLCSQNMTPSSNKKIWWQCVNGHEWQASVKCRTMGKTGCPQCAGVKENGENSLLLVNPILASEWHPNKNIFLSSRYITPYSHKKVWWQCINGHEWRATVSSRTHGRCCPYCSGYFANENNNLFVQNESLAKEWHPSKNVLLVPRDVTPFSDKKVWWLCNKNHEFKAKISDRNRGSGCPFCSKKISKKCTIWLDTINITEREIILKINNKKYIIDGFDQTTNTIYEFLGNYWHGNPDIYNPTGQNSNNKKDFGILLAETILRFNTFIKAGFKIVYKWENSDNLPYKGNLIQW